MRTRSTPIISFTDADSCYSVVSAIAEREFIVDVTLHDHIVGLPCDRVMAVEATDEGLWVVELDDKDMAIRNVRTHIGWDEMKELRIR